ncbi:hypothetical protein CQ13_38535 [Bradyrhizobium retamae]|uniref:Uncharacterized protein n=1 Tax=Bradyrhizobium retamae TaxID=1300035 RepID=A0A0R3NB63_9BRAD|nr:hypothetical protein CQ13_38535 [Bradyrhizobium retamae]
MKRIWFFRSCVHSDRGSLTIISLDANTSSAGSRIVAPALRVVRSADAGIGLDYHPVASRNIFADGPKWKTHAVVVRTDFLGSTDVHLQSRYLDDLF